MNNQQAKLFKAELDQDLPALDLHGFYPTEALEKLELFLFEKYQEKEEIIRIIYGGGTGKLRDVTLECLNKHELVDTIKDEGGSCIVLL